MPLNSVGASGLTGSTRRRVSEGSRAGLRFLAPMETVLDAAAITDEHHAADNGGVLPAPLAI
jgi:hypothetical protein